MATLTRTYMASVVVTTLLVGTDLVSPWLLYYHKSLVWRGEWWRLGTCFFLFVSPVDCLILYVLLTYLRTHETAHGTAHASRLLVACQLLTLAVTRLPCPHVTLTTLLVASHGCAKDAVVVGCLGLLVSQYHGTL